MKKYLTAFLACLVLTALTAAAVPAKSNGNRLVPFTAQAISGETVDLEKIMNKQPVMLFFWASW